MLDSIEHPIVRNEGKEKVISFALTEKTLQALEAAMFRGEGGSESLEELEMYPHKSMNPGEWMAFLDPDTNAGRVLEENVREALSDNGLVLVENLPEVPEDRTGSWEKSFGIRAYHDPVSKFPDWWSTPEIFSTSSAPPSDDLDEATIRPKGVVSMASVRGIRTCNRAPKC